jgi:hypothetical protein
LNDEGQIYYQEQEIVYIENRFHHPFAQEDRGSFETCLAGREHTERNVLMENRDVPILHELPEICLTRKLFVCPENCSGQTKKFSLRDLPACRQAGVPLW